MDKYINRCIKPRGDWKKVNKNKVDASEENRSKKNLFVYIYPKKNCKQMWKPIFFGGVVKDSWLTDKQTDRLIDKHKGVSKI